MDPRPPPLIVSPPGMATAAAWPLRPAAAGLAARLPDPSLARRLAGSRAWAGLANATSASPLTPPVIESALTGRGEALLARGIVAVSYLVCGLLDRARGRS